MEQVLIRPDPNRFEIEGTESQSLADLPRAPTRAEEGGKQSGDEKRSSGSQIRQAKA